MFDSVKLEKGLYNLSGKTFTQALEEIDPSENYMGTPLEHLDAYERQLKRFDIKTNGENCDRVERFFSSTEAAILFPEYLKRCLIQGIEDTHLSEIIAVKTITDATVYKGLTIEDSSNYGTIVTAGGLISDTTISEDSTTSSIRKLARVINCSYEVIRQQKIEILSIQLRVIGRKIGLALYGKALDTILTDADSSSTASTSITYSDLINTFGEFENYDMNTIIASPSTCANILQLDEIVDHCCCCNENQDIILPFGAKLIKSSLLTDAQILAIDRNFALEFVTTSGIQMLTDTVINRQLDRISIGVPFLFRTLVADAMKAITIQV